MSDIKKEGLSNDDFLISLLFDNPPEVGHSSEESGADPVEQSPPLEYQTPYEEELFEGVFSRGENEEEKKPKKRKRRTPEEDSESSRSSQTIRERRREEQKRRAQEEVSSQLKETLKKVRRGVDSSLRHCEELLRISPDPVRVRRTLEYKRVLSTFLRSLSDLPEASGRFLEDPDLTLSTRRGLRRGRRGR